MGKYTVVSGQNIFDVALHVYGSIEGITDLMMSNPKLSLANSLKAGDILSYSDNYVINADIVAYNKTQNIIPANGERHIYYKTSQFPDIWHIYLNNEKTIAGLEIRGNGNLNIDWGDNTDIESYVLDDSLLSIQHIFDNKISSHRKIKISGELIIKSLDLSNMCAISIQQIRPHHVDKLILENFSSDISFITLSKMIFDLNLSGITSSSLFPLLELKMLGKLNLKSSKIDQFILDLYLICLVQQYYERRPCTISLSVKPSGQYQEPKKDENLNYILNTGMEAVWVLVNEPAWNEVAYWKFIINDEIYTNEYS